MQPPAELIKTGVLAALRWRRPAVRHLGDAVDPQCLARGGGGRGPGLVAGQATASASTSTGAPPIF